ncbi:SDR family oxidoreductase [Bradyrhizobium sp. 147]|uniref:SDR family oxidoreductase n=1 Tax=Bradyrhizobium sp. 147 TaxID=2782623 RepID=UPI001FF82F33|nr:SDR family oxidoreductase [Bradyrhizobium sp. 147]MCK1683052.1 SDR family oxidoreductase [Bradyrhizobium sp. 147]
MFTDHILNAKKILISGGGTGIGKSLGTRFLELGAEIVICGRREEVLKETVAEWRKTGGKAAYFVCDISVPDKVDAMFEEIWRERPLDGLVNNAAINTIARTETLSPGAFDSIINVVLHGNAYCTLGAGKRWIEDNHQGTILSIVTSSGWQGRAFMVPSAAAKAGVISMMRSLAVEWGPKGIRTVMVAPGIFPTPGSAKLYPDSAEYEAQLARVPMRRVGQHGELADLCSYLMSVHAGFINGDCITIDGGGALDAGANRYPYLQNWGPEEWEEFRAQPSRSVASQSDPAWRS